MKHVTMFSGGIGSWMTAKRVAEQHGTDNLTLLFADVKGNTDEEHVGEDADTYRFIVDAHRNVGGELVVVEDGRNIWEVFKQDRFLGNSRLANCSKFLKQIPCRKYLDANFDPADTVVYVGIDWSETHRLPAIEKSYLPYRAEAPLTVAPFVDKQQMLQECRDAGIRPPRLYGKGYPHNNCFAPETRFITSEGIKSLAETLGMKVRVLGSAAGWRDATVKSFGLQSLSAIQLARAGDTKTIEATADHLWPVRKASGRSDFVWRTTAQLKTGNRIAGMYGQVRHNVVPSAVGVAAGFTFGDGTAPVIATGQIAPAKAFLCGDKDKALEPYFRSCRRNEKRPGVVEILDLPRSWKKPPDLSESQSYLYGWLAGYFAADGSFSKGSAKITSSLRQNLEIVRDVCARIGIATNPIRVEMRRGYGQENSELFGMSLLITTLREDFFIIDEHRSRFQARSATTTHRPPDWQVTQVVPDVRTGEVMCAVVPDGHGFTLEDNIFTHNCGGFCVRAGHAQFRLLLAENPERYAFHEREEQKLRDYLGKDVSVLKDRSGGTAVPLTLSAFRERQESGQEELFDPFDFGGCGCFVEAS